jgi:hypothetical protein
MDISAHIDNAGAEVAPQAPRHENTTPTSPTADSGVDGDNTMTAQEPHRPGSARRRRRLIIDAVASDAQFSELNGDEANIAHALIDANIARRAASERFGAARRRSGQRTVSLDDDGNLTETAADGTTRCL